MLEERRGQMVGKFRASREELMSAIEGLSEEEMAQPSIDGWSVKDQLVHISHWNEILFVEILRVSEGLPPAVPHFNPDEMDRFNELIRSKRVDWPVSRVLAELEFTRARMIEALENCDERALDQANYGMPGAQEGAEHESEHASHIRKLRGI